MLFAALQGQNLGSGTYESVLSLTTFLFIRPATDAEAAAAAVTQPSFWAANVWSGLSAVPASSPPVVSAVAVQAWGENIWAVYRPFSIRNAALLAASLPPQA